jgi:hypothetical protein
MEKGFGGEIPCMDVQQGEVLYYLQGFNAQNDPVATAGDRNRPYKVPVKRDKIEGEAPHLPGREPSRQCADTGDCPPGFPGCSKAGGAAESTLKSEGEECEEDTECKSGTCGKNKQCTAEEGAEGKAGKRAHFWIGVSGQLDLTVLPSASNVCRFHAKDDVPPPDPAQVGTPINTAGYYCTTSSGADFPTNETNNPQPDRSDKVSGGIAPANVRVMLTLDYAITTNIMAGIRFGYVLNTYPGSVGNAFAPVHVEGRFTYVVGKDALARAGLAPYVFVAGGVAEWDAQVPVTVQEKGTQGNLTVQAWNVGGPGFASLGGGIRYAFTPRFAGTLGARVNAALGGASTLFSVSPELGVAVGF